MVSEDESLNQRIGDLATMERRIDKDADLLIGRPPHNRTKLPFNTQTACLQVLTVLAVLYTANAAAAVIFPIVLAVLIALLLKAPVQWLARLRIPKVIGAAVVLGLVICLVGAGIASLAQPATQWLKNAPDNLRQVELKVRSFGGSTWADMQVASAEVKKITEPAEGRTTLQVEVKQPSLTSQALNATNQFLIGAMLCLALVFLLLAFGDRLLDAIVGMCPPGWDQRNMRNMFAQVESMVSRYLLTYTVINLVLGITIGCGLWLMGMPNPFLWGVMAACLNFIPFVGFLVGTIIVTLVAILTFDSMAYAMLAPAIYLGANGLETNILSPALLGRSLKLSVIMIFVFIVLWGWIWGIGGALIAVPLLAVLKIACDHFEPMQPLGRLLTD